ncbi:MAG: sigma-70 family RNA polymerase sigma factor [Steroidobacteraceae bacterium]
MSVPSVLERVAAGERSAFDECVRQYGDLVWSIARKMSRSAADAEDAVQEIFLKLWRSADRFDPMRGSEPVFIATVARRALIDRIRSARRRPQEVSIDEVQELAQPTTTSGAEACVEARRAAEALETLRPEQRQVIALAIVNGLSQSEIATQTGMPLGTVKTLIRRGLLHVRQMLGEEVRS